MLGCATSLWPDIVCVYGCTLWQSISMRQSHCKHVVILFLWKMSHLNILETKGERLWFFSMENVLFVSKDSDYVFEYILSSRKQHRRETPQKQLSRHNHFLKTTGRGERNVEMTDMRCEGAGGFFTILPLLRTSFQPPSFFEQLKSLRYIIGANQSRMRKALRWDSRNYLPLQPACSLGSLSLKLCPRVLW